MAAKRKEIKMYHANGYTYDVKTQGGQMARNFTDPDRLKKYNEQSEMGAVGPERIIDYAKRMDARKEYIEKNQGLRTPDTSGNKSRGTPSSAVRKIIK